MKTFLLINFTILIFLSHSYSQDACNNIIIQTPAVPKPTEGSITSVTCTALAVQWKGAAGELYLVNATIKDPGTGQVTPVAPVTNINCDNDQNCSAIIPVTAGMLVTWSVQAVGVIDDRTFYSYPFRGEQDYAIPACGQPVTSKSPGVSEHLVVSNEKLALYPNPVSDAINVQWNSAYKGNVQLTILDVSGKAVKAMHFNKEEPDYNNRISVSALTAGMYFVEIKMQNGKSLTSQFLKN